MSQYEHLMENFTLIWKSYAAKEWLSKKTKLKVMNATVLTTLVYGYEVWNLAKQQESRVSKAHRWGYWEELTE